MGLDDGLRYELVDGEPRAMAPASTIHGFVQNELGRLTGNHLRDRASGCEVVANPGIVPRLFSEHNVRFRIWRSLVHRWRRGRRRLPTRCC
jgi:hypothetical protein